MRRQCINKVNGLWFGFLSSAFRTKSDPGICKKKYPFYIRVFVEPIPLPILSMLKKYFDQTRFYRKGTLFRSTCKPPANTLSTLTKPGEGWRALNPILERVLFFANTGPEKKHKTGGASPLLATQTVTAFTSNLPTETQCVSLTEGCNLKEHLQGGSGFQPRDAL